MTLNSWYIYPGTFRSPIPGDYYSSDISRHEQVHTITFFLQVYKNWHNENKWITIFKANVDQVSGQNDPGMSCI